VAIRLGLPGNPEELKAKVLAVRALSGSNMSDSLPGSLPRRFAYGKDSLRARYTPKGDSIIFSLLTKLKIPPIAFLPLNDSEAFCPSSEDRLAIARNGARQVTGLWWNRPSGSLFLPNSDYAPRKPRDIFADDGAEPDSQVSEHGGSSRDTYVNHGARRRYACSQDGFFLKAGDGWVETMRKGETGDVITLREGGDGLVFKVTGQAGKRVRLELIACGEKNGAQGGVLMEMRGGADAKGPYPDLVSESDWVRPSDKGDTVSFSPIRIPSDPYYLDLRQVHTQGDSLYYSFDGYRAWSD
jgi:hypothetical protein